MLFLKSSQCFSTSVSAWRKSPLLEHFWFKDFGWGTHHLDCKAPSRQRCLLDAILCLPRQEERHCKERLASIQLADCWNDGIQGVGITLGNSCWGAGKLKLCMTAWEEPVTYQITFQERQEPRQGEVSEGRLTPWPGLLSYVYFLPSTLP